jgi:hypothetical protein
MAEENNFSIAPVAQAAPHARRSNLDGQEDKEDEAEGGGGCFCCWWMQDSEEEEEGIDRTNSGLQRTDSTGGDGGGKKKKKLKRKKPPPKTSWGSPAGSKRMSTSMTPPSACLVPTAGVSEVSVVSPPTAFAEIESGEEDAFANSPSAVIAMSKGAGNESSGLPPSGRGVQRNSQSGPHHQIHQPDFSIEGQQLKKAPSLGGFSGMVPRRDTETFSAAANPPGFSAGETVPRDVSPRKPSRSGIVSGSFSTSPEVNRAVDDRVLTRHESATQHAGNRPGSVHNATGKTLNPFTLVNGNDSNRPQPKSRSFDDSDED